jgi:hypothetical protein
MIFAQRKNTQALVGADFVVGGLDDRRRINIIPADSLRSRRP